MTNWKELIEIQKESFKLELDESGFSIIDYIKSFPKWKRVLFAVLLIGVVPATIGARYGFEQYTERQLQSAIIVAHQSYLEPTAPKVGQVTIFKNSQGIYSAYAELANENLDVAATGIPYQFDFYNAAKEKVSTISGVTYLLPNQKKYLIVPRVESSEQLQSATATVGAVKWQKQLDLLEVGLKAPTPIIYNSSDPMMLQAEGAVINSSAYRLGTVRLQFLVYGTSNQIIAVSQREEYNIPAFGRRAYKQSWPDIDSATVSKIVVQPDTDTIDGNNLVPENINATNEETTAPVTTIP